MDAHEQFLPRPRPYVRPAHVATAVFAVLLGTFVEYVQGDGDVNVRPASCAGTWYPGEGEALEKQVDELLAKAPACAASDKPVAVISPHAGYRWAGPVMASGFRCLQGHTYKRVVVLAFSHSYPKPYKGVEVTGELTAYETPLGLVPIDRDACDQLLKHRLFQSNPAVDRKEHSLENLLPFLQRALEEFRLVPLLVGQISEMSEDEYTEAAKAIIPLLDSDTLLVASSDFTHYGAYFDYVPFKDNVPAELKELADKAAAPIQKCDFDGFAGHLDKTGDTICGRGPIKLLLRILSMLGRADGLRTGVEFFGRISGDWSRSVTYQSIVFTRRTGTAESPQRKEAQESILLPRRSSTLDSSERKELLKLARQTVTAYLEGKKLPDVDASKLSPKLTADGACFVTLQNHGQLRGCIGNMEAMGPLYEAVIRNAVSACRDHRFVQNPVTSKELSEIDIEISYLTPMKRVADVNEIIVGRHGLLIAMGPRRGVLLPQVAYERGWTRDEFLTQTCRKAGLPLTSWKEPEAQIFSFEAEVFGEHE
jgi:AmmeMemoRadiSam system protein B/AmmeMemoRadiSam system protein A